MISVKVELFLNKSRHSEIRRCSSYKEEARCYSVQNPYHEFCIIEEIIKFK
jgi:hypothetical protein